LVFFVEAKDEGVLNDYGIAQGFVNNCVCVVGFPVVEAVDSGCRVKLSLGEELEKPIEHPHAADSVLSVEVGKDHGGNLIEEDLC
jgi:hypothetical protein